MTAAREALTTHLLQRLRQVRANLGLAPDGADDPEARFADLLDSMGLVEFLTVLAEDCGVTPEQIERCADRRFGTVAVLATALDTAGLVPGGGPALANLPLPAPGWGEPAEQIPCWLGPTVARLPAGVQTAAALDEALGRPAGWLEQHAGIRQRGVWSEQDPLEAAASAGRQCLQQAGLLVEQVGALLVTSQAPPLLAGLAAALHHRLDLRPGTVALEIGGACTGYLAALWTARALLARVGVALVIAVEAPSRLLRVRPGAAGEAAALFGDAAAAAVLCQHPPSPDAVPVAEVRFGVDGGAGSLIRIEPQPGGVAAVAFDGEALAARAVRTTADAVRELTHDRGLTVHDLEGVVMHGGNRRLPALLARRLDLPPERVWSTTEHTGNLGSASLPVTWAERRPGPTVGGRVDRPRRGKDLRRKKRSLPACRPAPHRFNSRRTIRTPSTMLASLRDATKRAVCEKPQSGVTATRSGSMYFSVSRSRSATNSGGSTQVFFTSTRPTASSIGGRISRASSISAISRLANSRASCCTAARARCGNSGR
jgi:3-oxoacyl-[acyl-carrier-protein] synthase-3